MKRVYQNDIYLNMDNLVPVKDLKDMIDDIVAGIPAEFQESAQIAITLPDDDEVCLDIVYHRPYTQAELDFATEQKIAQQRYKDARKSAAKEAAIAKIESLKEEFNL